MNETKTDRGPLAGLDKGPILVTGASGGIGGATVRQLEEGLPTTQPTSMEEE
jgi:hypothetical protein